MKTEQKVNPGFKNQSNQQKGENNQKAAQIPFLRQQQKLQKQRIKKLYEQINIEKQKSKRIENQHRQKMQKLNKKVFLQSGGNVYQPVDDNDYKQIPVDGETYLGSRVYMVNCSSCHSLESTTNNNDNGPSLGMIFNRKVGTDLNYLHYSKNLIDKSFYWNSKNLYKFFANPFDLLPSTRCGLAMKPIKSQSQRADLITFIKQFSKQLQLNVRIQLIQRQGYEQYQTKLYAQKMKKQKIKRDLGQV